MGKNEKELGQYIPVHYHFHMLADENRMNAFRQAIKDVTSGPCNVVELGSGTGVMSYNSAKLGARVWAVEANPELVSCSRNLLDENGVSDMVTVVESDASKWIPDQAADIVICEMLHSALIVEKQIEVVSKFRDAHIRKFNRMPVFIPAATLLAVQPVFEDYDFGGYYAPLPFFESAYFESERTRPCHEPIIYKTVIYEDVKLETIEGDVWFEASGDCEINALRFITKNILSIDESNGNISEWWNQSLVIPMNQVVCASEGQKIKIRFSYQPGGSLESLRSSVKVEKTG